LQIFFGDAVWFFFCVVALDAESGKPLVSAFSPASEMKINSPRSGFAEQDPETWWQELIKAQNYLKISFVK
jgi:sugar (pentulose or hexulose) kinase